MSGFEPPTFTLATCESTDVAASRTPISSDYERGVAKTVATCKHDEVLEHLVANWQLVCIQAVVVIPPVLEAIGEVIDGVFVGIGLKEK